MDDDVRALLLRMDHVEQYLVRIGEKHGPEYHPTPGFVPAPSDVIELARGGKMDDAVSRYQELTDLEPDRARSVLEAVLI